MRNPYIAYGLALLALPTLLLVEGCGAPPVEEGVPVVSEQKAQPDELTGEELLDAADAAAEGASPMQSFPIGEGADDPMADLSPTQRNSINMLNYLSVLVQGINASSNGRLRLEEVYDNLLNNTAPNAVDEMTLIQLNSILDTLEDYRMVDVKRERLQYIYEQSKAQAVSAAIPNPLVLLSAVQSVSLKDIALTVVYSAVDSVSSYSSAMSAAETQYIQEGWALDDEESAILHQSRKDAFSYMIRMVGDYDLPGELALSEKAIDEFVSWSANPNVVRRIQFLEDNESTYRALGSYWLVLAQSYYENEDYQKCLGAVGRYESLENDVFRCDHEYASVLPFAIAAGGEVLGDEEYVPLALRYAQDILQNSDHSDWALRYFVAQTYIDLYARTADVSFLQEAYGLTLDTVNYLIDEQRSCNAAYVTPIQGIVAPSDATEEEKKQIQDYNKMLKEGRKVELAPLYEPLILNCDLLFALADRLEVGEGDLKRIDGVLHGSGEELFLVLPLEERFLGEGTPRSSELANQIELRVGEMRVPVQLVSDTAEISLEVDTAEGPVVFSDWCVDRVERGTEGDVTTYVVVYTSDDAGEFAYEPGMRGVVTIDPCPGYGTGSFERAFETVNTKSGIGNLAFWDKGIGFVGIDRDPE